jgi:hypothetical protein
VSVVLRVRISREIRIALRVKQDVRLFKSMTFIRLKALKGDVLVVLSESTLSGISLRKRVLRYLCFTQETFFFVRQLKKQLKPFLIEQ